MNGRTDYERFEDASVANRRLLRQEELILDVASALDAALEEEGLTKVELARRLGKTKGFVSQILAGGRNLTLRTIADVADALGRHVDFRVTKETTAAERVDQVVVLKWPRALPSQRQWRVTSPVASSVSREPSADERAFTAAA